MEIKTKTRKTKTTKEVERILQKDEVPLTLEDLHSRVRKHFPKTAYSTTYRIIQRLMIDKTVTKVDWKDRGSRYEWSDREHHHHLTCEKCDATEDISDEILNFNEKSIGRNTGYLIKHHSIEILGICKPCQKNKTK